MTSELLCDVTVHAYEGTYAWVNLVHSDSPGAVSPEDTEGIISSDTTDLVIVGISKEASKWSVCDEVLVEVTETSV